MLLYYLNQQESDSEVSKSHSRSEFKMDLRRLLVTEGTVTA